MGIPFCWYGDSEALLARYGERIDGAFYLQNIQLVGIEVGNTLFVFEQDSNLYVLTDLKHSEQSLPGSSAGAAEERRGLLLRAHPLVRAGFDDGEIHAARDRCPIEQPCVSRAELECHADTSTKIDEWLSGASTTLASMLEGYEYDSDDGSVVYGNVHIMEPSEAHANKVCRGGWSVGFQFLRGGKVLCDVEFPARYLWMDNWREQLKDDSKTARQERHADDVSSAKGRVSDAERGLKAAKRQLARVEEKEV